MIRLPLCDRVAENTLRNGRFWTPDGRRRRQLDAASSFDAEHDRTLVRFSDYTSTDNKFGLLGLCFGV